MQTEKRLDEVFQNAKILPFDDTSKIVFFSDVHRGDNSLSDDFARNKHIYFHALDYYYDAKFTYVEIGDGDELWEHSKFKHILSAHPNIFNTLKNFFDDNRFIMLYGNHNIELKNPNFVKNNYYQVLDDTTEEIIPLFDGLTVEESIVFEHTTTGQKIFVVHGHQGDLLNDQLWWVSKLAVRYFWRYMHIIGVNYAASPAKNKYKRHKIERKYTKWNLQNGVMLLCGHTHRAKFPSKGEASYFNSGCCMHPRGINCIEINEGKIMLVSWHMHTQKDGLLFIKRTVLKGPEDIITFYAHDNEA